MRQPVRADTALTQREHFGAQGGVMPLWQDQKAAVVGDELESPLLVSLVPANPALTRRAFQSRRRETQQRDPFVLVGGNVPQRVAYLGQVAQVVVLLHQFPITQFLACVGRTNRYWLQIDLHSPLYTRVTAVCSSLMVNYMIPLCIVGRVNSP